MIFGAFKRLTIVDLLTYAILAVPFVLLTLWLPERLAIPDWVWAVRVRGAVRVGVSSALRPHLKPAERAGLRPTSSAHAERSSRLCQRGIGLTYMYDHRPGFVGSGVLRSHFGGVA